MKIVGIENTPNPNAPKILLDGLIATGTKSYFNPNSAKEDPLASQFFAVPGVRGVMLLGTFITITKAPDSSWDTITPELHRILSA